MTPSNFRRTKNMSESEELSNPMLFSPPPPLEFEEKNIDSSKEIGQHEPFQV